jgi:hypothetical protein
MITKAHIVDGALQLLAVEGLLLQPMASDQQAAVQHLDDLAASYTEMGLDTGYISPLQYGSSTGADDAGINIGLAGPLKTLLAGYIAQQYGKQFNPSMLQWAERMLTQLCVAPVGDAKYPNTLPIGSGNYDGPNTDIFYRGR